MAGPGLAAGYLGDSSLTAHRFLGVPAALLAPHLPGTEVRQEPGAAAVAAAAAPATDLAGQSEARGAAAPASGNGDGDCSFAAGASGAGTGGSGFVPGLTFSERWLRQQAPSPTLLLGSGAATWLRAGDAEADTGTLDSGSGGGTSPRAAPPDPPACALDATAGGAPGGTPGSTPDSMRSGVTGKAAAGAPAVRFCRTGDTGRVDAASGMLHITGRVDLQTKIRGSNSTPPQFSPSLSESQLGFTD